MSKIILRLSLISVAKYNLLSQLGFPLSIEKISEGLEYYHRIKSRHDCLPKKKYMEMV